MRIFVTFTSFLVISFLINWMQKTLLLNTFGEVDSSSLHTSFRTFSKFDAGNTNLFQIKVSHRKINGTTLAKHLIKIA